MTQFFILVIVVVILASVCALSAGSDINTDNTKSTDSHLFDQDFNLSTSENDEERTGFSVFGIEKANSLISTKVSEKIQAMFKGGKSIDDIFTALKFTQTQGNLLNNPKFAAWVKFVDEVNGKTENVAPTITILTAHYGDKALAQMIEAARNVKETKALATKLQADQMRGWLTKNKSPDNVYELLGIATNFKPGWESVLTTPEFKIWFTYVGVFNKGNPSKKESAIFELVRVFQHNGVKDIIKEAQQHQSSAGIARIVQKLRVKTWLSAKHPPATTFSFLQLNNVPLGHNLLTYQEFGVWAKYFEEFNKKYPDEKTNMIRTFLTYYRDEDVVKMLANALKNPFTKTWASYLQNSLLNNWVRELKSPDEVAKLLGGGTTNSLLKTYTKKYEWAINSSGDKLFDRQDLNVWLKYVDFVTARHPGTKASTISILTERYGDEAVSKVIAASKHSSATDTLRTAKELETAQLQHWLTNGKSSDDIFKLLRLDQEGAKVLGSSKFETWIAYYRLRSKKNAGFRAMYEALSHNYNDEELSKILIASKKSPPTKERAAWIQRLQVRKWLDDQITPSQVSKWLGVEGTTAKTSELLVYEKYVQNFHDKYLVQPNRV